MKRIDTFIDKLSIDFAGLDKTLREYSPVSEKGKISKNRLSVYVQGDEEQLKEHHRRLAFTVAQFKDKPENIDRIRYYLKDLPRIDDLWDMPFGQAELALLSSFRFYHAQIKDALKHHQKLGDWLQLCDSDMLDNNELGSKTRKSFYLADDASEDLREIRNEIKKQNKNISETKKSIIRQIASNHGLSDVLEEWIIDRSDTDKIKQIKKDKNLILISESVSTLKFGVKKSPEHLKLLKKYDELLVKERHIEQRIYSLKEQKIVKNKKQWISEQDKLCSLDLLLAMAEMALRQRAVKPEIDLDYEIKIENGRHIPFVQTLREGETYTPLDINLKNKASVLSGTNMGGKTVVLQSICWLQALVQLGFFVPAEEMKTTLFNFIDVSASTGESLGGLSGFGREIDRLKNILKKRGQKALFLIDEPGRTTHVREGRAIVQAIIDVLQKSPSMIFVSTHLDNIGGTNIGRLKMAGLLDAPNEVQTSRKYLQNIMNYKVLKQQKNDKPKNDAIKVAEILGLDQAIIKRAKDILDKD